MRLKVDGDFSAEVFKIALFIVRFQYHPSRSFTYRVPHAMNLLRKLLQKEGSAHLIQFTFNLMASFELFFHLDYSKNYYHKGHLCKLQANFPLCWHVVLYVLIVVFMLSYTRLVWVTVYPNRLGVFQF